MNGLVYVEGDGVRVLIQLNHDVGKCRKEFESIMHPGPNPYAYNTPIQKAWLDKIDQRQKFLTLKYGGSEVGQGPEVCYSPMTFVHWLIREKGAKRIQYTYCDMDDY